MTLQRCPTCESDQLHGFLLRDRVPVHQNLLVAAQSAARDVERGTLDIAVCETCGFVFNRAFEPALLAYGEHYDGSQFFSASYATRLDALIDDLVRQHGVHDCTVVEVGCGRGWFLHRLASHPTANIRGIGFDPSYTGPDTDLDGRLEFRRCYYDASCTDVTADVVICRHVIEHMPDPQELLRTVRMALERSPGAQVFFETPCVEWILRNRVIWDFFYEHCSLFTAATLSLAFERSGFSVKNVEHIFGGQYLWLEAYPSTTHVLPAAQPSATPALAHAYGIAEQQLRSTWLAMLRELQSGGKVALWGAGAKGSTFANLIDPNHELIDCLVDVNPNKQGRFISGTGHQIVALQELPQRGVKFAVLMNANYREEIRRLITHAGIELELIDWSES